MRSPSPRLPVLLGVVVVVALAVAAGWLLHFGATGTGTADADAALLTDAVAVRGPRLTTAAVTVTTIGSTAAMAILAVSMCVVSWLRGRRADALFVAAAALGGSALFRLLKSLFDRPRPPVATRLVNETNESLPSGHATMSVVIVGALVVLVWPACGAAARVVLVAAATLWVAAVGATRIYLGVHWFSDVLAGWFVGATWLAVCVVARRSWGSRPGEPAPQDADPITPDDPAVDR
ncbi:phosphatase PAP2 family protein [Pseudonocardia sp. N23]|uniref:phosphatase PAP2 family protein n=1 Tax=Pseudonocardia sp. N23 TaxID=1987376 RepID=UPI000BFE2429|nr:phosphatase PAP2 family protein [Pseudonocardia sp. N23]GAY12078.1 membrane-associated phospholipid phosphatase [Pseudonocardia sp. N23]